MMRRVMRRVPILLNLGKHACHQRLAELFQQLEAISEQLDATLDDADKRVIKNKMSVLEK